MTSIRVGPPFPAGVSDRPGPIRAQDQGSGGGLHKVAADLGQVASAGLRSLILIALAILLILVLLPAAFVAAGT